MISCPDKKTVALDDSAWIANVDEEDAIDESITVTTFENVWVVNESTDTDRPCKSAWLHSTIRDNIQEFLSSAKKSESRSSDANLSSFKLSFFPSADELVSVSSRAMTTTGTGVADFAVLGL